MNSSELNDRLRKLNIEDFIWIIYIGIIILSFYSNSLERKYFLYKSEGDKNKYRTIIILIFTILVFVYIYFLQDSLKSVLNLKKSDSENKKKLTYLSFIASLLITVAGFIYLYVAISDENVDIELAFN